MQEQINDNLKKIETWKRIVFMLLFALVDSLVRMVLWVVVILHIASVLLTGAVNSHILEFGRSLSAYHYKILLFLTFNTERMPFPFATWNESIDLAPPSR